jgi:hypothetical protein
MSHSMNPLIWRSITGKTIEKTDSLLMAMNQERGSTVSEGFKETFWGDGNMLSLDCDGGDTTVKI